MRYLLVLYWTTIFFLPASAQQRDTIKTMFYNILNFPDGRNDCSNNTLVDNRWDTLRNILDYADIDVLMVCELQNEAGADSILNNALNHSSTNFARATYIPNQSSGNNLQNMIFYNQNKLILYNQSIIVTQLRDINKYTFYANDPNLSSHQDTLFIDFYVAHLDAGLSDSLSRAQQADSIRKYVDTNQIARNAVLVGDLNVYTSHEAAMQTLYTGIHPFFDPINITGDWSNDIVYAPYHTQSTRAFNAGNYDCGATGGLDDRFDFQLISAPLLAPNNPVQYIVGSYNILGNAGDLFNRSINDVNNISTVPSSVLNNLFFMSDHLPVLMDLEITLPQAIFPIEILAFDGQEMPNGNLIEGKIALDNELIEQILLLRSTDAIHFDHLVEFSAEQTSFSYLDNTIDLAPIHYYQLAIQKANQSWIYSPTIAIENKNIPQQTRIYPNPTQEYLTIEPYPFFEELSYTCSIFTTQGILVQRELFESYSSINNLTIDVSELAKGLYFMEIDNGILPYTLPFQKN